MTFDQDRATLLSHFSLEVVALADAVSAAIGATALPLEQTISLPLRIHYFKHKGVVAAISLHKSHINLHFYKGTRLKAPAGVLQGSGKLLRHLRFTQPAHVDSTLIQDLVNQAFLLNN